jgi:hypothetical protein
VSAQSVPPSFFKKAEQKAIAEQVIREQDAQQVWDRSVIATVEALKKFYATEGYHQEYVARNPYHPCCLAVATPKVARFRKQLLYIPQAATLQAELKLSHPRRIRNLLPGESKQAVHDFKQAVHDFKQAVGD